MFSLASFYPSREKSSPLFLLNFILGDCAAQLFRVSYHFHQWRSRIWTSSRNEGHVSLRRRGDAWHLNHPESLLRRSGFQVTKDFGGSTETCWRHLQGATVSKTNKKIMPNMEVMDMTEYDN